MLPDATTSSAEAIREYLAQKARAGGPRLTDSMDSSTDGEADASMALQESRSGGDVVTSGSSSPQGKRVLFEFHRMSSYRYAGINSNASHCHAAGIMLLLDADLPWACLHSHRLHAFRWTLPCHAGDGC